MHNLQKEADKNKVERPEWMLVPPEVDYLKKAGSGKSRQFTSKTIAPEDLDSSGWTETPADKQRRLEEQRLGKRKATEEDFGPSQLDIEKHRNVQQYNVTFLFLFLFKEKRCTDFVVLDANKTFNLVRNAPTKEEKG